MRYIIAATAFALTAGIALGVIVSEGLDGSASAAPPTQAVEEQNLDASGSIAVHEQGVADVNVVSMPSLDSGPQEFTHVIAKLCSPSDSGGGTTGFCGFGDAPATTTPLDVNAELTALSAQGWSLTTVIEATKGATDFVVYTLSRPAP